MKCFLKTRVRPGFFHEKPQPLQLGPDKRESHNDSKYDRNIRVLLCLFTSRLASGIRAVSLAATP